MISKKKGTYALVLQSLEHRRIRIGRLGLLEINPGYYIYVGSAFGPGGLQARISHHLRITDKPHWHIDYLRRYTYVVEVWYSADPARREYEWVEVMAKLPRITMPMLGFGASDAKAISHLFTFDRLPKFKRFYDAVMQQTPQHAPILQHKI